MSNRSERTFKILIYESEYRQIQAWTNKFQNLETGGDLFGLWHDERTAVVQLVVGPGKQCRRRSTSFYQDVEYLRRIGDAMTSEEGLCHIGEWHSHHRLSLTSPSGGDETTIWSNMDRYGLSRFVLCIANISTSWSWFSYVPDGTTVNVFLFEVDRQRQYHRRLPVLQAVEFIFLEEESPFRSRYLNIIQEGAESLNTAEDQLRVVVEKCKKMESEWKKVRQKLETSLEEERKSRKETDIRLAKSQDQAADLQRSLTAERKAKRETEKTLNSVVEKAHQLQSSLSAQTHARDAVERRLYNSEQQAHQLQSSLAAQTQARDAAERRLCNREQRLNELETSLKRSQQTRADLKEALAAEQKAHEETRTNLSNNEQEQRNYSSEQQAHQLQSFLDEQAQAREDAERRLHNNEQRSHELETSLKAERQARVDAERRLHDNEQRSKELETSLAEEQKAHKETKKVAPRQWLLDRNEITLSDTKMREGEWGRVVEGSFYDGKVAVKVVQRNKLLRLDRSFFYHEMEIAFECRHPCLLQFIGATCDDQSLLFVSELPDTSLKAVLHERRLKPTEITTIALDVAKGLNYLHLRRPAPVVHGDISSATVLLWKKGGVGHWQAKISDFYTINFLQQSMSSIYTAPEAHAFKSPKVDVYSFGVLLCEMKLGELPNQNNKLDEEISRLPYFYRRLIICCLGSDPAKRCSMAEIMEKIEKSE